MKPTVYFDLHTNIQASGKNSLASGYIVHALFTVVTSALMKCQPFWVLIDKSLSLLIKLN